MDAEQVKEHWRGWAEKYGTDTRATSYTRTLKELEVEALTRQMYRLPDESSALEVGCGNGINCVELAKRFPHMQFYGVDYLPEMIVAANQNAQDAGVQDRVRFCLGDVLDLHSVIKIDQDYDVVISDRCLINLGSLKQQKHAIEILATKVCKGGHLLMIENSLQAYAQQNRCRMLVGLPEREPPPFNLFLDEWEIFPLLKEVGFELSERDNFLSLHDLVLYVLLPYTRKHDPHYDPFHWEYDHPMMEAATKLSKRLSKRLHNFPNLGQARLLVWQKKP